MLDEALRIAIRSLDGPDGPLTLRNFLRHDYSSVFVFGLLGRLHDGPLTLRNFLRHERSTVFVFGLRSRAVFGLRSRAVFGLCSQALDGLEGLGFLRFLRPLDGTVFV